MKHQTYSALLAAALLTASCTVPVLPAAYSVCAEEEPETKTYQDFQYQEKDGGISITGVTFSVNDMRTSLTVPAEIDGKPVTEIGKNAFFQESCMELTEITLPDTLKRIGTSAFYGCWSLKSLTLPEGLEEICPSAFSRAAFEQITIPESVTEIGYAAFESCLSLKEIRLPEAVTYLQWRTFNSCPALEKVVLSPKTATIGRAACKNCPKLKEINLPDTLESVYTDALDGTPWLEAKRAENPLVCSDGGVFLIDGKTCTGEVVIPDTVQRINGEAFSGNAEITGVTVPESVTAIGDAAFFKCTALKKAELPAGLTVIPDFLFNRSGLEQYTFRDTVTAIGIGVFMDCHSLKSVILPDSLTKIDDSAFLGCDALEEMQIPESVTDFGIQIAAQTPWLEQQHAKQGAYVICNGCLLDAAGINGSAVVPDSVKHICGGAFLECENVTDILVPAATESIGAGAFFACMNLRTLTVLNPACEIYDPDTDPDGRYEVCIYPEIFAGLLRGYDQSTLQQYAERHEIRFDPAERGDADGDLQVSIADAQTVLKEYTNSVAGKPASLSDAQRKAADVNGDSAVTVEDAQLILKYYVSNTVAGSTVSWKELT